ncbi:hypothetical protein ASN18_3347 [Candidatus Magnetominusculus xianensis]|uniref:Uncharacterized protein n=1 Tax=Candidatus Magnetominusculus xianensis TaxID=1748249 RepID=A0ABR5SEU8_9BACT|nr:hypothetical protein ASN18_3347 [Candidatus Magnetominusculus xianensis]
MIGTPNSGLAQEMHPFMKKLPGRFPNGAAPCRCRDAGGVEPVVPPQCLLMHLPKISSHSSDGICLLPEPEQLRVAGIAPGHPLEHLLGQQRLPPQGDQTFGVEIPGVKGPESHTVHHLPGFAKAPKRRKAANR